MTSKALKYFGYGIPAFALIKVLANFFFGRDNTKTPFYVSIFIMTANILLSLFYFREIGFIIIPIATSISTWLGIFIYIFLLYKKKYFTVETQFLKNFISIIFSTFLMSLVLFYGLDYFQESFTYNNKYKSIFLLLIISFVATIYLISCYLLGILKLKNYKIN